MYYAGIDIGSLSTKTVIVNLQGNIIASSILRTGANSKIAGEKSLQEALAQLSCVPEHLTYTVATGYGRISIPFADKTVTEITCHGRGAYHLFPNTRTVIDIGGQDSKVIRLDENGKIVDFAMNDKCAAGTGRFLEVMAKALEIDLERMGPLSLQAHEEITISSVCTVFAESEVVSLVAQAKPKEDIINSIHNSVCSRIAGMVERVGVKTQLTMTGGVAKNVGIVEKLKRKFHVAINIPEEPQIVGALGAALLARDFAEATK